MEFCILDIEGTHEEIVLNAKSESEVQKTLCNLEEILENVELGAENTIKKIGDAYITSVGNANWYKEIYGWVFSKQEIAAL